MDILHLGIVCVPESDITKAFDTVFTEFDKAFDTAFDTVLDMLDQLPAKRLKVEDVKTAVSNLKSTGSAQRDPSLQRPHETESAFNIALSRKSDPDELCINSNINDQTCLR